MSSKRKPYISGEYYHLYNEGCDGRVIFVDDRDYVFFLSRLLQYSEKLHVTLVAWCLMPTHYHLFVRQDGSDGAGKLAQYTCNSYSKYFNRRHARRGTLFASPYKVKHVQRARYFVHLVRYIHANPVVGKLVERPELWTYSNYRTYCNEREWRSLDARVRCLVPTRHAYLAWIWHHIEKRLRPGNRPASPYTWPNPARYQSLA